MRQGKHTLSGTGGADIAAFSLNTVALQKLIVTKPNLLTLNSIDSSQDFHLKWNGNNGIGEISVSIVKGQDFNASRFLITRPAQNITN